MPHVVLKGNVLVENIFEAIQTLMIRSDNRILRTSDVYLERKKNVMLVNSLTIEADEKIAFLVMISGREDGVVIRLYPKISIEKTEGVKKIIGEIAKQMIAKFPQLKIGETNLQDYLK